MVETATTPMGVNPWEVSQALCVSHYYNSLISQIYFTDVLYLHRIQWGLWQCWFRTRTSLWKRRDEGTTAR